MWRERLREKGKKEKERERKRCIAWFPGRGMLGPGKATYGFSQVS